MQRDEKDLVHLQSGIEHGITLGTPIGLLVRNEDQRPKDYSETDLYPRPSHADWTYLEKYGVKASSGGGRSSARETIGEWTWYRTVMLVRGLPRGQGPSAQFAPLPFQRSAHNHASMTPVRKNSLRAVFFAIEGSRELSSDVLSHGRGGPWTRPSFRFLRPRAWLSLSLGVLTRRR